MTGKKEHINFKLDCKFDKFPALLKKRLWHSCFPVNFCEISASEFKSTIKLYGEGKRGFKERKGKRGKLPKSQRYFRSNN